MVEKSSSVLTQSVGSAYAVWMPMVFQFGRTAEQAVDDVVGEEHVQRVVLVGQ